MKVGDEDDEESWKMETETKMDDKDDDQVGDEGKNKVGIDGNGEEDEYKNGS